MTKALYAVACAAILACTTEPTNPALRATGPVGGGPGNTVQFARACVGYACTFTDATAKGNYNDRRDWFSYWSDSIPNDLSTKRFVASDFGSGTSPTWQVTFPTCPATHSCKYETQLYRWATSKAVLADSVFVLP